MAEYSEQTFDKENAKNEEMVLFAEDFVSDVMFRHSSNYTLEKDPLPYREYTYSAFNHITRKAVLLYDDLNKNQDDSVCEMLKGINISPATYKLFADKLVSDCFAEGFGVKLFFVFCISISRMAASYYDLGITDVPELAKSYIIHILQKYDVISGGWGTFHSKVADAFDNIILNDDLLPENVDSGEMVHLNRRLAQYQVSEDESSSSRSETQNVLSEDDRIKLNLQEKNGCSNKHF